MLYKGETRGLMAWFSEKRDTPELRGWIKAVRGTDRVEVTVMALGFRDQHRRGRADEEGGGSGMHCPFQSKSERNLT